MITAVVTDPNGVVLYNVTYQGFEFFLGAILGSICGLIVWTVLKSIAK